ncbi:MAG: hypothetical protein NC091_02510, partial [Bacteroides sp.]|nr:hypothetical protein [Bacteroides sp.]
AQSLSRKICIYRLLFTHSHFDKEMVNPNIPRTIRFTQPLYDWLMQVKERENLSFNQVVLQCCKNS